MAAETIKPRTRSGLQLPEGSVDPRNYVGDPNAGEFVDWDAAFLEKGYAPPAEANVHGTPSVWMGKATGFGKTVEEKIGAAGGMPAAPMQPQHQSTPAPQTPMSAPAAQTQQQPAAPAVVPGMAPQQSVVPDGNGSRPMPFAMQLAPLFEARAQPQPPNVTASVPYDPQLHGHISKGDAPAVGAFGAGHSRPAVVGESQEDEEDEDGKKKPPVEKGAWGTMLKGLEAIVRLSDETLAKAKKQGGEGQLSLFGGGAKEAKPKQAEGGWQRGPRGGMRRRKGKGWEYKGSGKGSASAGGSRQDSNKAAAAKRLALSSRRKYRVSPAGMPQMDLGDGKWRDVKSGSLAQDIKLVHGGAKKPASDASAGVGNKEAARAAKHGDLDTLFPDRGDSHPRAADMKAIGDNFAAAMSGKGNKGYGMQEVFDKKGAAGLRSKLAETRHPRPLTALEINAVMTYATKRAEHRKATGGDPVSDKTAEAIAAKHHTPAAAAAFRAVEAGLNHPHKQIESVREQLNTAVKEIIAGGQLNVAQAFSRAADETIRKLDKTASGSIGAPTAPEATKRAFKKDTARGMKSVFQAAQSKVYKHFTKSMEQDMEHDLAGRALSKGLYGFRGNADDTALPDEYLYDYLVAFVEEAYEHESREGAHARADMKAEDQLQKMARAIMSDLVRYVPTNKNLLRACKKHRCTVEAVKQLLVRHGIYQAAADSNWTSDADSHASMGASLERSMETYTLEAAMPSRDPMGRPGVEMTPGPVTDVSHLLKSEEAMDPFAAVRARAEAFTASLWKSSDPVAVPTVAGDCPVHGLRDISKAQQVSSPMTPCTCGRARN